MEKVVITVVGRDRIGIIAEVCNKLASLSVNVMDISQTICDNYFNMIMIVDVKDSNVTHKMLQSELSEVGNMLGVQIKAQKEEIFSLMHRV